MDTIDLKQALPEPSRGYAAQHVRDGAYADAGERLRQLIEECSDSGPATPLTEAEVADVRQRVSAAGR